MTFVRVFGNTYLNPDAVGKIEQEVSFPEDGTKRTTMTSAYDLTGKHKLFEQTTTVLFSSTEESGAIYSMERDNHLHAEIIRSLRERTDAIDFKKK